MTHQRPLNTNTILNNNTIAIQLKYISNSAFLNVFSNYSAEKYDQFSTIKCIQLKYISNSALLSLFSNHSATKINYSAVFLKKSALFSVFSRKILAIQHILAYSASIQRNNIKNSALFSTIKHIQQIF